MWGFGFCLRELMWGAVKAEGGPKDWGKEDKGDYNCTEDVAVPGVYNVHRAVPTTS